MIQITTSRGPNRPQSHLLVVFVELNGGDQPPLVVQAWAVMEGRLLFWQIPYVRR